MNVTTATKSMIREAMAEAGMTLPSKSATVREHRESYAAQSAATTGTPVTVAASEAPTFDHLTIGAAMRLPIITTPDDTDRQILRSGLSDALTGGRVADAARSHLLALLFIYNPDADAEAFGADDDDKRRVSDARNAAYFVRRVLIHDATIPLTNDHVVAAYKLAKGRGTRKQWEATSGATVLERLTYALDASKADVAEQAAVWFPKPGATTTPDADADADAQDAAQAAADAPGSAWERADRAVIVLTEVWGSLTDDERADLASRLTSLTD